MPTFDDWKSLALKEQKKKKSFSNPPLKSLYTERDLEGHKDTLPGFPPFVRGARASMYTGRPWTIRQYAGFSTAEESNAFYRRALASGAQGISVAFDLPTHRGYDSDHPRVQGDVGQAGVAIDSVEDMVLLFDKIPLGEVSVSMTMNGAVLPIMAFYIVAAEEQGVPLKELSGTIQNDILKEYIVRNTYIFPPRPSLDIVADLFRYTREHMPRFNCVSVSGYHMQEAGADAVLELAYTLCNGKEYIETALKAGMPIDDFAPRLSFFFGIGLDFYREIAKLRAARFLWSEIVAAYNPRHPHSLRLRTHCQTSGWSLTAQDPWNNVTRTTIEAMAAIFGGTQSLHTNAFDEAMALPSELSSRIARNTQIILQEETDIPEVIDPWGGSYMMESLTQKMIAEVRTCMKGIEEGGGMLKAIETGRAKMAIEACAAAKQAAIDRGEKTIVGVNKYTLEREEETEIREIDRGYVFKTQCERLSSLRRSRDQGAVKRAMDRLTDCAQMGRGNVLALSVEAARVRCTGGEIIAALEKVWGRYRAETTSVGGVYGQAFENKKSWTMLTERISAFEKKWGRRPRMLVAKMGQDGHDRGAKVVATAFADAGFDVDLSPLFTTPSEVAAQAIENDVHIVGISSQAGGHKVLVPQLIENLKALKGGHILVALGGVVPSSDHVLLKKAGVCAIFGPGTPVTTSANIILEAIEKALEVRS